MTQIALFRAAVRFAVVLLVLSGLAYAVVATVLGGTLGAGMFVIGLIAAALMLSVPVCLAFVVLHLLEESPRAGGWAALVSAALDLGAAWLASDGFRDVWLPFLLVAFAGGVQLVVGLRLAFGPPVTRGRPRAPAAPPGPD